MKQKIIEKKESLIQFVKFAIVGCSNTLISLAVYYALIFPGVHYVAANAAGFVAGVCNAFYWNNKYVFKEKTETSTLRAFGKVFVSYGGSFLLSTLLITLLVEVLHVSEYIAPLLRLAVTVPLNFFLNKVWAFKDKG